MCSRRSRRRGKSSPVAIWRSSSRTPLLLLIWRRCRARPVKKAPFEPTVSIVIAAHNEREQIEFRLQNCLALDYPKRKLQIIVSLDGPTDGTEFIVWKYAARGVEMVHSK